jgi:peptidoglycan-N-acetylglucosamine deacetylase
MSLSKVVLVLTLAVAVLSIGAGTALADVIYVPNSQGELSQPDLPEKSVALTFDDGPSAYTDQVLDILRREHVHATFFVIGEQAAGRPLLRRIYEDGHEIGNHTYTHTDLSGKSWWRQLVELNLTRIVIESQTGHSTRVFRPPYLGSDIVPLGALDVIHHAGNLGYITAGMDIDSDDWRRPGTGLVAQAAENPAGGVILLHDGGGVRDQTVAALPQIIRYYRERGFHFDTVSQTVGLSRDQVMPTLSPMDRALAALAFAAFTFWAWFTKGLHWLILIIILAGFARAIMVTALAIIQARRRWRPALPESRLSCSVVIPAYNEAAVLSNCLRSILSTNFPNIEVLVVDDGSTDATAAVARRITDPRLRVLRKPNGGKARALNFGIRHARGQVVIAIDADTIFQRDTIPHLLRHFADPRVGAVSGNTKIVNRHKLITKLQSLEYIIGFNLDRRMGDLFDCITVVPGAVGAFRRSALYEVNGFAPDTLAEDTDLTLALGEAGHKIVYDDEAIAYTEAPATVRELLKQRFRWTFGTMQAAFKHRGSLFNPRKGTLGLVGLPYLLFFQIIFPLFGPFFDLTLLVGLITHQYQLIIVSFVIYSILDLITAAVALKLDHEPLGQLWILFPQSLFYRQLMYYVIARSTLNVLKGKLVTWSKLKREGLHLAEST